VFSVGVSQRAADGLMLALDDPRFDVRLQSARSLAAILERNPLVQVDRDRVYEVVLREVAVGRPVSEGLAHVFTLLGLVLSREPLQIAFRSLQADDPHLRGTALEYLEGVLPSQIRQRLWPFLVNRPSRGSAAARSEVIAKLVRSGASLTLNALAGAQDPTRIAGFGNG
jgi:hypothetical protein